MTRGLDSRGALLTAARWTACALVAGAAHAAAAVAITRQSAPVIADNTTGAYAVDIAPEAVALMDVSKDIAPGQLQPAHAASAAPAPKETEPEKPRDEPPESIVSDTSLPELAKLPSLAGGELPPIDSQHPAKRQPPATATAAAPLESASAPQVIASKTAPVAAAPTIGSPNEAMQKALTTWQSRVLDQIERNKRYPAAARAKRYQGTVIVTFRLDDKGQLVHAAIGGTSGIAALDAEAIAILKRASPFPVPPEALATSRITLSVPVRFQLR